VVIVLQEPSAQEASGGLAAREQRQRFFGKKWHVIKALLLHFRDKTAEKVTSSKHCLGNMQSKASLRSTVRTQKGTKFRNLFSINWPNTLLHFQKENKYAQKVP